MGKDRKDVLIIPHSVPNNTVGLFIEDIIAKFHERGIVARPKWCVAESGEILSVTLEFVGYLD